MSYLNHNDGQFNKIVDLSFAEVDDVNGGLAPLVWVGIVLAAPVVAVAIAGFIDGASGNEPQTKQN